LIWRVGLIDSCGGLEGLDAAARVDASPAPTGAAAFLARDGRVECRATVADPTGHGSRIAALLMSGRRVELLLGQVFTGSGPTTGAAVSAAIGWAVEQGAGLVHLSLGLAGDRAVLALAVRRAIEAGCVLVAAMPARGAPVFPAAYPGVIRATGDARCAPGEISCLGPRLFGGCPRVEVGGQSEAARRETVRGGASIGAAWVTHAILQESPMRAPAALEALTARAKYLGPERRTPMA